MYEVTVNGPRPHWPFCDPCESGVHKLSEQFLCQRCEMDTSVSRAPYCLQSIARPMCKNLLVVEHPTHSIVEYGAVLLCSVWGQWGKLLAHSLMTAVMIRSLLVVVGDGCIFSHPKVTTKLWSIPGSPVKPKTWQQHSNLQKGVFWISLWITVCTTVTIMLFRKQKKQLQNHFPPIHSSCWFLCISSHLPHTIAETATRPAWNSDSSSSSLSRWRQDIWCCSMPETLRCVLPRRVERRRERNRGRESERERYIEHSSPVLAAHWCHIMENPKNPNVHTAPLSLRITFEQTLSTFNYPDRKGAA